VDMNQSTSSSPFVEENRRILLIDDNVAIHDDYRKILVGRASNSELDELGAALFDAAPGEEKRLNFEVSSAYQGQDGLSQVALALEQGRPFAMAFVDMRMPPGWDGLETIKRIWEVDPYMQVVICSAYSDHSWSELVDALPSVGQWLLLRKPFDSAEVSQLALALTKKWELERESRERVKDLERIVAERTQELRKEMQDRLAAQLALRENDARIRAVFDTTQNGIVIFNEAGKLECANRAACQMFGIQEEELSQKNITDLIVGPDGQPLRGQDMLSYGSMFADTAGAQAECLVKSRNNSQVAVSVKVSCFISCSERMYAALLQDLSDFKHLQDELAQANKLQAVGQLAAEVANEINTPLQFLADKNAYFEECFEELRELVLKVEELNDGQAPAGEGRDNILAVKHIAEELRANHVLEELPNALHDSTEGVRRVQEIVNSMRVVAEFERESFSSISLPELLEESIVRATSDAAPNIEVVMDCEPDLPVIDGHAQRLQDAFFHILNNALDATRIACLNNGVLKGLVNVRTELQPNWIEVTITDNGCGIPESSRHRVFEPFFTTKAIGEGRGQGLAVSRATIVEGHHGEIDFDSEEGRGTTFRVRLPLTGSAFLKEQHREFSLGAKA
jgi:two-component system, NtrC family, sensor kinase